MLQAKNLSRNYGDVKAVERVSFSVEPGEVVGLLGHNGAGKSTIMKMLTGFIEPSQGEVVVDGMSILEEPELVRESIGYLPESPPIYPELSVLDFLQDCCVKIKLSEDGGQAVSMDEPPAKRARIEEPENYAIDPDMLLQRLRSLFKKGPPLAVRTIFLTCFLFFDSIH